MNDQLQESSEQRPSTEKGGLSDLMTNDMNSSNWSGFAYPQSVDPGAYKPPAAQNDSSVMIQVQLPNAVISPTADQKKDHLDLKFQEPMLVNG